MPQIPELPAASALTGNEKLAVDQGGVTKHATAQAVSSLAALNETKGADIASAATTDIGAATGKFIHITGTTTITSLGVADAGIVREVVFDGILTLTHNATSLILPAGINIQTRPGDAATFRSEGSGNWRCTRYTKLSGQTLPKVVVLTDGATINVDASLSDNFRVTLAGNRTLANPTGLRDGQVMNFRILQDATGGRTLAYGTKYKFPGGTAPVLSTAAAAIDFMSCQYDATGDTLFCVLNKDFK